MTETVFTNARVVMRDRVFDGSVQVRDGRIVDVSEGSCSGPYVEDCEGDYLLPGLIDLHTDNVEKHMVPRPGARWSAKSAVLAHDAQCAAAGITTVFDALCIGNTDVEKIRVELFHEAMRELRRGREQGLLRIEHFLHARCEVSAENLVETFDGFQDDPMLRMVSVMDHTPGVRQFTDIERYKRVQQKKLGLAPEAVDAWIDERLRVAALHSGRNRQVLLQRLESRALPVASHDDRTVEHVEQAAAEGITIAEFPVTMEAARASRKHRMMIIHGAPNVVRGGSHNDNVSAMDLARNDCLDVVASDYVPSSMLLASFKLHDQLGIPLPDAVAKVTANAAESVGLDDRGQIAVGRRADLVRVAVDEEVPFARRTWREGQRVS
ncbi:MAG: alpha-D-ribose 1-methylphosphonate 5-triphosphate diphosphatase [Acetobacterales bacterium]